MPALWLTYRSAYGKGMAMRRILVLTVFAATSLVSNSAFASDAQANGNSQPPMPLGSPGDWVMPSDYPLIARMNAHIGVTAFKLRIDANGVPSACEITESSSHALLDEATCSLISARARFAPAKDEDGQPVASVYPNRVRWVLPNLPADTGDNSRTMTIEADVSSSGVIERCRLIQKDELIFRNAPDPCPQWLGTQAIKPQPNQKMPRVKMRIKTSLEFVEVQQ
ncbi:MAG: energy transducer TonB [Cytophagaceae bacterium]|nr:MAG: energy transducer TonB [Cytophagaceae bacterium]